MKDSRLSRVLHVLIHLEQHDTPLTSEKISNMLNTNPALVRRIMSGLRDAGYVNSEKGHNGGWTLTKPLSEITLLDVYNSIGEPEIFALDFSANGSCLVEQFVNNSLKETLEESRKIILKRFSEVTLDNIVGDTKKYKAFKAKFK